MLSQERIFASLTSGFGALALVLACIGIYGTMAYSVTQRTSEIGIRMALGARPESVMRMVLGEASWVVFIGLLAGLAGGMALARTVEPDEAIVPLLKRLRHKMALHVLPMRRLRINRREIKQIYHKYKPKKRGVPPPAPFEPEEQFLDCVELLDPLALTLPVGGP